MFEEVKTPPSSANNFVEAANQDAGNDKSGSAKKKLLILFLVIIVITAFIAGVWWLSQKIKSSPQPSTGDSQASSSVPARLDDFHLEGTDGQAEDSTAADEPNAVEYLYFSYFYHEPENIIQDFKFSEYATPVNVKLDVSNYYDVSRKLNLDSSLESLNKNGFAVLDNPWPKEANDFYALGALLDDKQIPLFISADFISYYYQSVLKMSFKEIEEGVFYESLWDINRTLYEGARIRYENHLQASGNINDRVLEGERLEAAFFAVSLELLKPRLDQVDSANNLNSGKFSSQEQQKFSFTLPSYLNDDVTKELEFIRAAKEQQKSPVLLYDRDYKAFLIPQEYKNNARLQNFYLTAVWLNSVFPLNYRDESCPECLLDRDDWRINFTAASLIAGDFADNQELKSEWARIYKIISFFKGLRDDWNYVHYRDALRNTFGDDFDVTRLFAEDNADAEANMEKLRQSLLQRELVPMQGGLSLKTMAGYKIAGLQFLADFYWPNDFIFGHLSYPEVGVYQGGEKPVASNVTACSVQKKYQRCQGSSQDILSLVYPSWQGSLFLENGNYANYKEALENLRPLAEGGMNENLNNYWSSLLVNRYYLNIPAASLPLYLRSEDWRAHMASSVLGAWTDMQLPLDKISLRSQSAKNSNLGATVSFSEYNWVEPNIDYLDRLLVHNQMILGMFEAIGLDEKSSLATNNIREAGRQLAGLRAIIAKQAGGEDLNADDNQFIRDFVRAYLVEEPAEKTLSWRNASLGANIKESLGSPRLLVIAHPVGDKIVFSVGPVFNHQESR
ncbi:MAG: DUF3160 domain-containing protein [Patescibacteria group bacterium]|nr:DUF3160 domain-containing protein [Patescibacteria group bacterium]